MKIGAHEKFWKTFLDILKHKNIQYFGTNIQEQPTSAEIATGKVELALITLEQLRKKNREILKKIDLNSVTFILVQYAFGIKPASKKDLTDLSSLPSCVTALLIGQKL